MIEEGRRVAPYFTLEGMCEYMVHRLQNMTLTVTPSSGITVRYM
jgi:hypothetical protein